MKTAVCAFLSVCTLFGCDKKEILVEGQVLVEVTAQPLPYAAVQIWKAGPGASSGYSKVGDPYDTDIQGRFSFPFPTDNSGGYILRAEKDPGYRTDWGYQASLKKGRNNQQIRLLVQAPAWLRVQLQDKAPIKETIVTLSGFGGLLTFFARASLDTVIILPCTAGSVQYGWSLSQLTGQTYETRTVQVAPLDTALVRIEY